MKEILNEKQLKSIRKRKQMTQKEFAERLGYSESYIQKLERGEKPISEEFANNLQKLVDLERAYRKACENYCEVQEAMNKKPFMTKRGVLCLIILVLIFVLLY